MVYTWTCCMLRSPHETLGVLFLSAWEVAVLPALVLPGFYVRAPGAEEPHGLLKCRTLGEGSVGRRTRVIDPASLPDLSPARS
jgi:hypothetical protein